MSKEDRFPLHRSLLFLVRSSLFWLMVGSFLGLLCAVKLVLPSFLDGSGFLTYGRLFPVACDLLVYGWAIPSGLVVMIWLVVSFTQTEQLMQHHSKIITSAVVFWNLGVFLGSLSLLAGCSTSVTLLEYPHWTSLFLLITFLLVGIWGLFVLQARPSTFFPVAYWYLFVAFCSFPWIYTTANLLLTWGAIQGSAQGPIHAWYVGNFITLWLDSLALAISYYLIPKITGRPIYSYSLAWLGFLSLLVLAGWSSLASLIGGPIPAWMSSIGVVTTILMFIPMMTVMMNFYKMLEGQTTELLESPALRFVFVGLLFYVIATFFSAFSSIPLINALLHFTDYTQGIMMLSLLGFFGMTLFGFLYYMLPRLTGITWSSVSLVSAHFWFLVVGVTLMVVAMLLGGLVEGIALNDAVINFVNVISYAAPWRWLVVVAWILLLMGMTCFLRLVVTMHWRIIQERVPLFSRNLKTS